MIRALGDRGDASAVAKLLEMARSQDEGMRASAFQALALLAGPHELPDLVQLVVQAASDEARSEAADALGSACQRIESRTGHCDVTTLVEAVRTGPLAARLALLPVCSGLAEAPVRAACAPPKTPKPPQVREAAQHALCNTRDGELIPDPFLLASGDGGKTRLLPFAAASGWSRKRKVKLSNEQKIAAFKTILDKPLDAPENAWSSPVSP